jgi:hypothetical protein
MRYILAIFGQRKERYQGQCAPELLDAIDDYSNDENEAWLLEKMDEHRTSGEFQNVQLFKIAFNGSVVSSILNPTRDSLLGTIEPVED